MTAYISLLWAVNVGGQTLLMKELTAACESLGLGNVRTYIQSGNVLFEAPPADPAKLERQIEGKIAETFGLKIAVMVRTPEQLKDVIARNPFPEPYSGRISVAFLSAAPSSPSLGKIDAVKDPAEQLILSGAEAFLYYPNGQGRSKMTTALIERCLGVAATVRNWRTVNKLLEMAGE